MSSSNDSWIDSALIARALSEDIGHGDVTTLACVPASSSVSGHIIARQSGIVAGLPVVTEVMRQVDPAIVVEPQRSDGTPIAADDVVLTFNGPARGLLIGERVALNFLGDSRASRRLRRSASLRLPARARAFLTHARPHQGCAPWKNTPCASAEAPIIVSGWMMAS